MDPLDPIYICQWGTLEVSNNVVWFLVFSNIHALFQDKNDNTREQSNVFFLRT